jgi:hypothetical protein
MKMVVKITMLASMNMTSFSAVKRLLCIFALVLLGGALAQAQNNLKPEVSVLGELVLPPIDDAGNLFFDLPAPEHLPNPTRGRYRAHFVLAPNTNAFSFVVDASGSTNGNSGALTYDWSYFIWDETGGDFFHIAGPSTRPFLTNNPPTLSNAITREMVLDVANLSTTERLWFGVAVLTPQQAVDAMIDRINTRYPKLTGRAQRRLLPPLREASAHFAAGETQLAKDALNLFLKRLRISRFPLTRFEARVFKSLTPTIINTATD